METLQVIIDALEYIKKFKNQIFVIKLGGEVMVDEKVLDSVARDIILLNYVNIRPVVLHGGGQDISKSMEKLGKKPKFIQGLRVTDKETMDIVKMVLIGKINTEIVARINKYGGNAVGLSGKSGKLFRAKKREEKIDLGFVGEITEVNSDVVTVLLEKGYTPIISPVGFSDEGDSLNINADTATGKLASSLKASKVIFLTDVEGVLDKKGRLIDKLDIGGADDLIKNGTAKSGMIPKLRASIDAIRSGVNSAHIVKSKENAILEEIFTTKGTGTMITKNDI